MFHKEYRERKNNHTSSISQLLKIKTTEMLNINKSNNTQIINLERKITGQHQPLFEELKLLKKTQITKLTVSVLIYKISSIILH